MKKGTFYSVGVGPGDPSLMTIKAIEIIKKCDVIVFPDSGGEKNEALDAAREHIANKRVVYVSMPMTKDKKALANAHDTAAESVGKMLDEGLSAAFLTLGDPSIYSTAMYVHKRLALRGYETIIVPGVPSFCAAAAALNAPLCEGAEPMHIIPANYGGDYHELSGTKVFMKSGKALESLLEELKARENGEIGIVRRASMENEAVFRAIDDMDASSDYFTIIVVKDK